ncbi:MAG: D-alanine--D-alanine ligase [Planctomycetota bacterium]|nr:MAG: D-alanine--D-alanine ligase [Planctomycetota bacterium]
MKLAVLGGGPSSEHAVSLQTSAFVLQCLRARGHSAHALLLSRDVDSDQRCRWSLGDAQQGFDELAAAPSRSEEDSLSILREEGFTIFIGLHGPFGEDGQVQRRLEAAGVPYSGSGPAASELGMDKELSKIAATKLHARTASHELIQPEQTTPRNALGKRLGYPLVIKPVSAGSSMGVSLVRDADSLDAALQAARAEDTRGRVLAEEYMPGVEVACSVFRRAGELVVLPLVSVHPAAEFYDYEAKYSSEATRYCCPAETSAEQRHEIERLARGLYDALQLRGVVRVDFILPESGGRPVFLELNTLPGFTSHSLVPMAAREAGIDPGELLEAVLDDLDHV